ncbi:hypothetical protein [Tellurirhabdus rosea]|uniref:hypothetical protein n=1 Tax=Tellurirhabdus rosea TaxID=2674997 RepID=UPI00225B70E9|nr:hypothetical protein [Tellurirhabdus rosea]
MKLFFTLLTAVLSGSSALAQSVTGGAPVRPDLAYATALYQSARLQQANLFNGIEHLRGYPTAEGHPYFGNGEWQRGSIQYDHIRYQDVSLLYDLTLDRVVVQHPDSAFRVALVPEKTESFSLGEQTFTHLREDSARQLGLSGGIYQILTNGPSRLLARRTKVIRSELSRNTVTNWFEQQDQYFLRLNGTYHPVKTKSAVLKLAGDQQKGLSRYWREKKVRFRKNRELALIEAARYLDTLKP